MKVVKELSFLKLGTGEEELSEEYQILLPSTIGLSNVFASS